MVVYIYATDKEKNNYTYKLIKHLCIINNIEITNNPQIADCIFVSICDITEINKLRNARKLFSNKKIIAGGFISSMPILKVYADYVVEGEAYNFFKKFSKVKHVDDIINFDEVSTQIKNANRSKYIDINNTPIIQCSKKAYYYYVGKYCPHGCHYCLYGSLHNSKLEYNQEMLINRAIQKIKNGKLFPMIGYFNYRNIYNKNKLGILDCNIKEFISNKLYNNVGSKIRTGIEFFSEKARYKYAKKISNDEIKEFFHICRYKKITSAVYFIIGLEPMEYIFDFIENVLPYDYYFNPRIIFALTYIDFQPFTKMADGSIEKKYEIEWHILLKEMLAKNKRVRMNTPNKIYNSTIRTLLQRCKTYEQAEFCLKLKEIKNNQKIIELVKKYYPEIIGSADYRISI